MVAKKMRMAPRNQKKTETKANVPESLVEEPGANLLGESPRGPVRGTRDAESPAARR
jgi:hypothetical protein